MAKPTRGILALLLAGMVLCFTASQTSARVIQGNGMLRVALVDIERISTEYTFNINAMQALQKQDQLNLLVLRALDQHPLLLEADHKVLTELVTAENSTPNGLTPAQKEQRQKLLDKSKALQEEYNALQQKMVGQLNAQDKLKLNDFFKAQGDAKQRFNDLQEQMQQALKNKLANDRAKALKDVRAAIATVAKQKSIHLVLSNEFVWYAENDLTDDVIKLLNNAIKAPNKQVKP
jgi:Skp family chaperone for outer membrane proteins